MNIIYDENNKKTLMFNYYKVIEKSSNYFAIYDLNNNLITHKSKWKGATKIASMLDKAYKEGYRQGYIDGDY